MPQGLPAGEVAETFLGLGGKVRDRVTGEVVECPGKTHHLHKGATS